MKIENVKIQNFKGITQLETDLNGRSVYVVGGNATGKTSFISAVFCALTGKNIPPDPIKANARLGKIEVELDGIAVELSFKKKGDKVEKTLALYNTEDGEKLDSPRSRLDAIIGNLEFNPFEFMRMQPTPQLNYFCKVFGIKGIARINDDIKEINESVNYDKKRLIAVKDQCEPYDTDLVGRETVSASELSVKYQEGVDNNAVIEGVEDKVVSKREQRIKLHSELVALNEDIDKGLAWLDSHPKTDTANIKALLDDVEETNKPITEAKKQSELHKERHQLDQQIEYAKVDKAIKTTEKKALITKHTAKIDGFDYDDANGFTLDGLPFHIDQNNTALQIAAGLRLSAGLLGDVKIARFDGSLLDKENLEAVEDFAQAEGLQLFVELVDRDSKDLRLEFVEDGQ